MATACAPIPKSPVRSKTLDGLYRYRSGELQSVGPHDGSPAAKVGTILPTQNADEILIGTGAGIFRVQGKRFTRLPGTDALDATPAPTIACGAGGGEEFLIVSHRLGIDAALLLAERIRDALASQRIRGHDGVPLKITCSVGIASLPVHPKRSSDLDAAITMADFALYHAKHQGRDRSCAVLLPEDARPGVAQADLREEIERLDACKRLLWRTPKDLGLSG